MDALFSAFDLIASWPVIFGIVAGTVIGVVVGVLPGLGPGLGVSLALPFTFSLGQMPSIAILLGVYCGSIYGGSITAILLNTPGTPASAATCLDGYPMARKGQAGLAIGTATLASVFGGMFSLIVLIFAAPQLAAWALKFGPAETFALAIFALTCIASVSEGAMIKGLLAGILGLFLSVIGQDAITGASRFTFDIFQLSAGLSLIPVLVGLFAVSEVLVRLTNRKTVHETVTQNLGFTLPDISTLKRLAPVFLKSSIIGTFLGILPGVGPTTASFVSYSEAKRSSKNGDKFGTGEPEGLIACEAANNAVTGGALVPTLALGIPGDPITAIMLGAFVIHDIVPGPQLFVQHTDLVTAIFLSLFLVNIVLFAFGAASTKLWTRVLRMPEPILMASVIVLVCIGVFSVNNSYLDLTVTFLAGIAGFLLRFNGFPVAPVVIGFVLGRMVEENLRMGLIVYDNSMVTFINRPIVLLLLAATVLMLAWPMLRKYLQTKPKNQ